MPRFFLFVNCSHFVVVVVVVRNAATVASLQLNTCTEL